MKLNRKLSAVMAVLSMGAALQAGDYYEMEKGVIEPEVGSAISGTLSFNANTHFISYGADVWGAGSNWDDLLFNPSLELTMALPGDMSLIFGTWWDVNDNAVSSIGNRIQEIDVWTGLSKDFGFVDATLLYQAWMYAGDTEQIIDLILGFELPLNPSLTLHGRPDQGAAFGEDGLFTVLGIKPGFDAGPVAVSVPVNVAFATDGFHGGSSGYGYSSIGLQGSYPLPIPVEYGEWAFNAGVTFYHTSTSVIPGNPDESFLTGNFGFSIGF